jgi:hypothetical protein
MACGLQSRNKSAEAQTEARSILLWVTSPSVQFAIKCSTGKASGGRRKITKQYLQIVFIPTASALNACEFIIPISSQRIAGSRG